MAVPTSPSTITGIRMSAPALTNICSYTKDTSRRNQWVFLLKSAPKQAHTPPWRPRQAANHIALSHVILTEWYVDCVCACVYQLFFCVIENVVDVSEGTESAAHTGTQRDVGICSSIQQLFHSLDMKRFGISYRILCVCAGGWGYQHIPSCDSQGKWGVAAPEEVCAGSMGKQEGHNLSSILQKIKCILFMSLLSLLAQLSSFHSFNSGIPVHYYWLLDEIMKWKHVQAVLTWWSLSLWQATCRAVRPPSLRCAFSFVLCGALMKTCRHFLLS